ncbi:MAG: class I SAM-dependent methyltransferase [Chloroflexi bacterium]|nr:class I SAM-dependent methyltransferase [Chloroflexota bacterium]
MSPADPTADALPRLYTDLADWYHLLTSPEDAREEAAFFLQQMTEALRATPRSVLDLGSGGGNLAWHYKREIPSVTLTDLSSQMLAASQRVNPELEHIQGDMRAVRLDRLFDAVLVHDAVCYLTTEDDLRAAMATAFVHCRPGGVAIFAPDSVRENFSESLESDGHDEPGRKLRYMMWTWDPDPSDATCVVDFSYLLHEEGRPMCTIYDRHVEGLFSRETWLRLLEGVGFGPTTVVPLIHSDVEPGTVELFVALKA